MIKRKMLKKVREYHNGVKVVKTIFKCGCLVINNEKELLCDIHKKEVKNG